MYEMLVGRVSCLVTDYHCNCEYNNSLHLMVMMTMNCSIILWSDVYNTLSHYLMKQFPY